MGNVPVAGRIILLGGVAAAALGLYLGTFRSGPSALETDQIQGEQQPAPVSGIPASAASTVVPAFGRAQAIDYARGLKGIYIRIDHIDAKLTTWGEWSRMQGTTPSMNGNDPKRLVWIVSVSGEHMFRLGHGMLVPWGGLIIDATTGEVLAGLGAKTGRPAYYDVLVDLAPR
jgi:hypothetical protein